MTNAEAVNWLINITADIGKIEHQDLWHYEQALSEIREMLETEPQRMRGRWIYGEDEYGIDGYHCNKCRFFVPWDYAHTFINYIKDYNFCPNCGAETRGEQNEDD